MSQDQFFGKFNRESNVWSEGYFTKVFREFSHDTSHVKKWIQLDGPIDYMWVENLNSILDDNKKMDLPNGETIKMAKNMCLMLECDSLKNVTPATISRCGLIHMHREETNPIKNMFN